MIRLETDIAVTADGNELFPDEFNHDVHSLTVMIDKINTYGCLVFSSSFAFYQFGLSLIQEAVYGISWLKELNCYEEDDGTLLVIDGIRLSKNSGRLFLDCSDDIIEELPNKFCLTEKMEDILPCHFLDQLETDLSVSMNRDKNYIYITFLTRKSMYYFGVFLLWQIIYSGEFQSKWLKIKNNTIVFYTDDTIKNISFELA